MTACTPSAGGRPVDASGELPPAGPLDDSSDDLVLLDGKLVRRSAATVSAFDRGVMYGESLFETLRVVDGAPSLWERHAARLAAGCRELGFPVSISELEAGVRRLLARRRVGHGILRIQVTGGEQPGGGRGMTASAEGRRPRVVVSATESPPPADTVYIPGVRVVSGEGFLRPSPWLKSGNYLASVRAKALAEAADAFECILVSGRPPSLIEGSFSNVLLWDGEALTSLPEGLRLPGVTLGVVLEEAAREGLPVVTRAIPLGEVVEGPPGGLGLLLTGSLLGVCPCSHLDGRALRPSTDVAGLLREKLRVREQAARCEWNEATG